MNNLNSLLSKNAARLLLVLITVTMTGCSVIADKEQEQKQNVPSPSGYEVNAVEPALVNLATESLDYNEEDKTLLLHAAAKAGLNAVYIPSKGLSEEGLIEVRRWEGGLSVMFKHFTIKQTLESPLFEENIKNRKVVKLNIGSVEWISQGSADPILYMRLDDMHIVIEPSQKVTKASMEAIADSLIPLTESNLPTKEDKLKVDQDYLMALRAANQFLESWVHRDGEQGAQMVTTEVKKLYSEEQLSAYFVGTSNPHHQAYEVTGSEQIDENSYRFKVWMYEHYSGVEILFDHPEPSYLTVLRTGDEQWLINELP